MRVLYVDDCPSCGCPVIADEPDVANPLLVAAPSCPDAMCACHGPKRRSVGRPVEA